MSDPAAASDAARPLCFVLMPFGTKKDALGVEINFDRIYEAAIKPAVADAGMEVIRADEERTGGIIHKAMFERLLLCDYAVADLTTANANVFYELGVRHAARPATTVPIFAQRQSLPFDVNYLRALPYDLGDNNDLDDDEALKLREALTRKLKQARDLAVQDAAADSPVFQLLENYDPPNIARLRTDAFREQARYSESLKRRLADARRAGDTDALAAIEQNLGMLDAVEVGVLVDLFLSYRAVEAWERVVALYERLPAAVRRAVMIREQLGLALNRVGRGDEAIEILDTVLREHGPNSETLGIMGRIFKDRWANAEENGMEVLAEGFLDSAIETYLRGFEADPRDAYPGINALLLLYAKGDDTSLARAGEYLPVIKFAVGQRIRSGKPDYWDFATLLLLDILEPNDLSVARKHLASALAAVREPWEPFSTAADLKRLQLKLNTPAGVSANDGNGGRTDALVAFVESARQALVACGEAHRSRKRARSAEQNQE